MAMVINEASLRELIREMILETINESRGIKSKKIYDIMKAHGGFAKRDITHKCVDLHNLTDDDVIGVITYDTYCSIINGEHRIDHGRWVDNLNLKQWAISQGYNLRPQDNAEALQLADGMWLVVITVNSRFDRIHGSGEEGWKQYYNKRSEREKSHRNDGKDKYHPMTPKSKAAHELYTNPYFRHKEEGWKDANVRRDVINKAKQGKDRWGNKIG